MTADTVQTDDDRISWSVKAPQVRKAIAFIKRAQKDGAVVNAEDIVEWDRRNGRGLFDWNNRTAGDSWRAHQARLFLNRFRNYFDKMRVRAFIHVSEDAAADIPESGYASLDAIRNHPGMRAQVIEDITRRMRVLASELKFWKLSPAEQEAIMEQLAEAMSGAARKREVA